MSPKYAVAFLLWFGKKSQAGDEPTKEELNIFNEAQAVSMRMSRMMGIRPEHYEYTPGQPFEKKW
jgi:hypothetical protein